MSELRDQVAENGYGLVSGILDQGELDGLREELTRVIDTAPGDRSAKLDRYGNTVPSPEDFTFNDLEGGRQVLSRISNQLSRSTLIRITYGNPKLLQLVESIYGPEFVPFAESIIVKLPENGAEIPYHQDGNRYDGVMERGLNVGIYLHTSSEANGCLRVIPDTHRGGKIDVRTMRNTHGPILPGSLPLLASPGDISLHDRSLIHGSLPNTSSDLRVTIYFGYHKLASVEAIHDADHIKRRAQTISLCIHERQNSGQHDSEVPYTYALSDRAPVPSSEQEIDDILRWQPLSL
jgi:phytanoyl-CoA hydroxylase